MARTIDSCSYCMMIFMKRKMTDYSENITQIEENIKERKRQCIFNRKEIRNTDK